MKKTLWSKILQITITVLTAIAAAFGIQACAWYEQRYFEQFAIPELPEDRLDCHPLQRHALQPVVPAGSRHRLSSGEGLCYRGLPLLHHPRWHRSYGSSPLSGGGACHWVQPPFHRGVLRRRLVNPRDFFWYEDTGAEGYSSEVAATVEKRLSPCPDSGTQGFTKCSKRLSLFRCRSRICYAFRLLIILLNQIFKIVHKAIWKIKMMLTLIWKI